VLPENRNLVSTEIIEPRRREPKRSRYDILYTIVKLCFSGQKKTQLMYKANLSYEVFNPILHELMEWHLVERHQYADFENEFYVATSRGRDFCGKFEEMVLFLKINGEAA
jgi:predicted transcriptional regulator